jgi:doubled CXXCH motif protein
MMRASIMEKCCGGPGITRRRVWLALVPLVLMAPLVALAKGPHGENVHRPDADCNTCHSVGRDRLEGNPEARTLLAADLEERCILCHDEGPSHHTGILPRKPVPATLPLSEEGLITCATCHFVHGQPNPYGAFLRIDNSRGGLCLTCHELSELR